MAEDLLAQVARSAFSTDMGVIGVAVSGGSDSVAMLRLLAAEHRVAAVTVDHGLRPEAAEEARFVADLCAELGVSHDILVWDGPAPQGNLMDQARLARLSLIGAWARGRGIAQVALGHTADDQAETFLMRLARESGLEGLAGMRPRFAAEGVLWHRPFLAQSRAELREALRRNGQRWIEDPSNDNPKYHRVQARNALKTLAPMGITAQSLGAVLRHLGAAEAAVQEALRGLVEAHVTTPAGDVLVRREAFETAFGPEMQRRLLNGALLWISGAEYAPRAAKIEAILAHWRERSHFTLHGCQIQVSDSEIRIRREARAVADLRVAPETRWDRWLMQPMPEAAAPQAGAFIGALGAAGLASCPDWRATGLPRASLLASPALWQGDRLLAAPLAGLENGWKAQIACGAFAQSLFRR